MTGLARPLQAASPRAPLPAKSVPRSVAKARSTQGARQAKPTTYQAAPFFVHKVDVRRDEKLEHYICRQLQEAFKEAYNRDGLLVPVRRITAGARRRGRELAALLKGEPLPDRWVQLITIYMYRIAEHDFKTPGIYEPVRDPLAYALETLLNWRSEPACILHPRHSDMDPEVLKQVAAYWWQNFDGRRKGFPPAPVARKPAQQVAKPKPKPGLRIVSKVENLTAPALLQPPKPASKPVAVPRLPPPQPFEAPRPKLVGKITQFLASKQYAAHTAEGYRDERWDFWVQHFLDGTLPDTS